MNKIDFFYKGIKNKVLDKMQIEQILHKCSLLSVTMTLRFNDDNRIKNEIPRVIVN